MKCQVLKSLMCPHQFFLHLLICIFFIICILSIFHTCHSINRTKVKNEKKKKNNSTIIIINPYNEPYLA